jgi:membrane protease subunit HflC
MKKKNPLTLLVGGMLLVVFLALLFCFQVRTTEVAVVTTFGRYANSYTNAGLYFRAPLPIQKVYKFDKRLQTFERKYEQQFTRDKKSPILSVYVGWRIADPRRFLESFNGDLLKAEQALENVVRDAKNSVIGSHDFTDLISPNPEQVKFDVIEGEMRAAMAGTALSAYGIAIQMVGIKELGLPESLTSKVFERMKTEREKLVKKYQGEGNAEADRIRSEADLQRKKLVAEAENQAQKIYGEAEAEATQHYRVMQQDPELAVFLLSLRSLEGSLKDRSTLILDERTPPFNLLKGDMLTNLPVVRPSAGR